MITQATRADFFRRHWGIHHIVNDIIRFQYIYISNRYALTVSCNIPRMNLVKAFPRVEHRASVDKGVLIHGTTWYTAEHLGAREIPRTSMATANRQLILHAIWLEVIHTLNWVWFGVDYNPWNIGLMLGPSLLKQPVNRVINCVIQILGIFLYQMHCIQNVENRENTQKNSSRNLSTPHGAAMNYSFTRMMHHC